MGRPKQDVIRKARTTRAFDEEWEVILEFVRMVKADPKRAQQVLNYGRSLFKDLKEKLKGHK